MAAELITIEFTTAVLIAAALMTTDLMTAKQMALKKPVIAATTVFPITKRATLPALIAALHFIHDD